MKTTLTTYKAWLLCLLAGALGACNSVLDDPNMPGNKEDNARFILLSLSSPAPQSRTQVPDTPGTEGESKVTTADLYLVPTESATTSQITAIKGVKINNYPNDPNVANSQWIGKTVIPMTLAAGDYYLYVIANPGKNTYSTNNVDDFIGKYTAPSGDDTNYSDAPTWIWTDNQFLMANTTNDGTTTKVKAGKLIEIPEKGDVEVTVSIERLAAKVEVDATSFTDKMEGSKLGVEEGNSDCTVSGVTIERTTLVNCVKDYNLIQHWGINGTIFNDGNTSGDNTAQWLYTPSSATVGNYTTDNYGNNYYNRLTVTTNADGNVTGGTDPDLLKGWVDANTDANAASKNFMYCLENNPPTWNMEFPENPLDIATKSKGRTTAVLIEAKVNVSDDSQLTDGNIYRFGNKLYTSEKAFKLDWKIENPNATDEVFQTELEKLKANGSFQTFKGGFMYYTVYLKNGRYTHNEDGVAGDDNASGTPYLYYGVFRNSWTKLNIKEITGWGDGEPVEPPTDPVDETKIGINTQVRVNYWKIENTEHVLGQND